VFDSDKYYQLGEITKSHGVKGELSLKLDIEISEQELKSIESVFVIIDGIPIPFFIENFKKHNNRFVVKFEDYNSIDKTAELIECQVLVEKTNIPDYDSDLKLPDLIGYKLMNYKKDLGEIIDYTDFNSNMLYTLENDMLIPANVDFIIDVDVDNSIVYMELPEGIETL